MAHSTTHAATAQTIRALRGVPWAFKRLAERLLNISHGSLSLTLPNGEVLVFRGCNKGPKAAIHIHNYALVGRVARTGDVGLAESYIAGEWSTPDLARALTTISLNIDRMHSLATGGSRIMRLVYSALLRLNANTRQGAKRNISVHYDLGNAFYEYWLDPSMTYSSARYDGQDLMLEEAQRRKYSAMAKNLDLKPDDHVLEIGCGWGGFADYAAREVGARVTGITISREQFDYASARIQKAQLNEKVDLQLIDYRDVRGRFDKVASIEMFEAVGQKYWPSYFAKISSVLKPAGRAAVQIITIRDDIFSRYAKRMDFIQRYIFPGGVLPSVEVLHNEFEDAGLKLEDAQMFGQDYARTLAEWHRNFMVVWKHIAPMGFDLRFYRLWRFYLAYCEAGFATGRTDVGQFVLSK
ncbi:MAG: SAM-dependent methyltransferase [Robiginitomaculum sp.]|nr:MAG: SAM-dependent methyltransferase [Robiginitomaculum sp.]